MKKRKEFFSAKKLFPSLLISLPCFFFYRLHFSLFNSTKQKNEIVYTLKAKIHTPRFLFTSCAAINMCFSLSLAPVTFFCAEDKSSFSWRCSVCECLSVTTPSVLYHALAWGNNLFMNLMNETHYEAIVFISFFQISIFMRSFFHVQCWNNLSLYISMVTYGNN